MMSSLATILISTCLLLTVNGQTGLNKAASPYTNVGCQCSSLTYLDSAGHIQGNCRSTDHTGARWCYVDSIYSTCQDLVPSARFPRNPWSYEGCATPPPPYVAPTYQHPVLHHPVHTAPVHHLPSHGHPVHQAPGLNLPAPAYGSGLFGGALLKSEN